MSEDWKKELRDRLVDFFNRGQGVQIEESAIKNTCVLLEWLEPWVDSLLSQAQTKVMMEDAIHIEEAIRLAKEQERERVVNKMFSEIAKLAEPDERQFGAGCLNTHLDEIHEIRKRLLNPSSLLEKKGEE